MGHVVQLNSKHLTPKSKTRLKIGVVTRILFECGCVADMSKQRWIRKDCKMICPVHHTNEKTRVKFKVHNNVDYEVLILSLYVIRRILLWLIHLTHRLSHSLNNTKPTMTERPSYFRL